MDDMTAITDIATLEALYGAAAPRSLTKVADRITPLYRTWIDASRFVIVSTTGPEGTDGSPRGDTEPVVRIADDRTLWLPDWQGNNRLDTLRNIVRDGRVSLLFMVPGSANVVRINGTGIVTADEATVSSFDRNGNAPRTVVIVTVKEIYFQCAKAIMRSGLWAGENNGGNLPSAGQFLRESEQAFDAEGYDAGYPAHAAAKMW